MTCIFQSWCKWETEAVSQQQQQTALCQSRKTVALYLLLKIKLCEFTTDYSYFIGF
jgi:hypothetical protein